MLQNHIVDLIENDKKIVRKSLKSKFLSITRKAIMITDKGGLM